MKINRFMRVWGMAGIAVFFLFLCNCRHPESPEGGVDIALRLEPVPGNTRNSEGSFVHLHDGRILYVYSHFTGGTADDAFSYLAGRYSSDGGSTWSDTDVVILPNEGEMNTMSVSLARLDNKEIAMLYLRKDSGMMCIPYIRFSDDDASSWSPPVRCAGRDGYYVVNNDRLVRLSGGRLIFPAALHGYLGEHFNKTARIMSFYSDERGRTWTSSEPVDNPGKVVLQEPGLVELKDGRLLLFCRTDAGVQYFSYSSDRGATWSPAVPGNIRSPLSPASIKRIPATGDLLLVWNNNYKKGPDGGKRTPLNIAVSKDEGKHWQKIKTVESDPMGWYCYTAIDFAGEEVLLGYCAGNTRIQNGLATTHITRLSLDWVYADSVPDPYVKTKK